MLRPRLQDTTRCSCHVLGVARPWASRLPQGRDDLRLNLFVCLHSKPHRASCRKNPALQPPALGGLPRRFDESLLWLNGLYLAVPDSSTLSRRQKTLKVNISDRGTLIDRTEIKIEGEDESRARKHGDPQTARLAQDPYLN